MTLKSIDLWLRDVWSFWDTHGSRLLNCVQMLHSGTSAIAAAMTNMNPNTAAVLLAISGVLGAVGRARSQNTAEIMSAKDNTDERSGA